MSQLGECKNARLVQGSMVDVCHVLPVCVLPSQQRRGVPPLFAAARRNLHLAIFNYPAKLLKDVWSDVAFDREQVTCLRSCLMKPEHLDWLERIWQVLDEAADDAIRK